MAEGAKRTRRQSYFDWSQVEPGVIRAMLRLHYEEHGLDHELGTIAALSPKASAVNAAEQLGSPPRVSVFTSRMCHELRGRWLPRASAEVIEALTTTMLQTCSPAGRSMPVRHKAERLAFLASRPMTANFRVNLRKAFVAAHRVHRTITLTSGADEPRREAVELAGQGRKAAQSWYPHQQEAHRELDRLWASDERFGARLVLPTGSGKTDTVAGWLLEQMRQDPRLRVLWLAHQQELVDQALAAFQALARRQPRAFRRRARAIHSEASTVMTLADPDLSVAVMTYQSFKTMDSRKRRALCGYLAEPSVVVVDEAHHAAAPGYHQLLDLIEAQTAVRGVLGLTATPYPTAPGAQRRFNQRFPIVAAEVSTVELIHAGILACPVVTTVDTGCAYEMTDRQVEQAGASDIPAEVLARLDDRNRDRVIVDTWKRDAARWGKTLAFVTRVSHANALAGMLQRRGANARALHSGTVDRRAVLDWFRAAKGPTVLVSVGMLTEGVDLPDARTAFLARPTTSPILMRQMIGRVLRGPRAGGDETAHLVHFRDEWTNLPDVLYPEEVVPGAQTVSTAGDDVPGPILDETGVAIREDLAAQVARSYERLASLFDRDDEDPFNDQPPPCLLDGAQVVGFYETDEFAVPVFGHQQPGFADLLDDAAAGVSLKGTPVLSYFDDSPPPYPSPRALKTLVALTRELGEAPPLQPLQAQLGPHRTARRILDAGRISEAERADLIATDYRTSISRRGYRSLRHYEEAVETCLRDLRGRRLDAERELPLPKRTDKPPLPRFDRDLTIPTDLAIERGQHLLPAPIAERLNRPPVVLWTRRCVTSTWGHWSLKLAGRGRGHAVIRINRMLRTRPKHVSDEMLAYLMYHELLHHLLPGQGHDAEFRDLESLWPGAVELDYQFDTLHEYWNLDPDRYAADVGH